MSQLLIAVFIALLSYADGQTFSSAYSGPSGTFTTTSTPYYPKVRIVTKEEKPKPTIIIVEDPAPNPVITIVTDEKEEAAPKENKCTTIVDVAVSTPELSILVDALTAANLTIALADPTLIATVLAPTNEAFEAVLETFGATLEQVLVDPQLTNILLYHVIGGTASTADKLEDGSVLTTVLGQGLTVDKSDGTVLTTVLGFCWCWIYGQCCGC
eukprot:TRINITY_DN3217_c0_g1_i9.p1 TRINITY_DN3217_c0_g1~~TRINITY_DN3217_c0_g1_i9.p1  ORF type:complete len:213 (-),score=49.16 TRINITY_DN3217_c0_g1_i9:682-1320(-)